MLEGPAERRILRAGQAIADLMAQIRISRRFAGFTRNYMRNNTVASSLLWRATREALIESLFRRKSPWSFQSLRFYALLLGNISRDIVDDNEYWTRLNRTWGGPTRATSDVKTLTKKILNCDRVPDLGYFVNGRWFDANWNVSNKPSLVKKLSPNAELVLKADYSERGKDVSFMTASQFQNSPDPLTNNWVVQLKIHQHDFFERLNPGKPGTLRLLSAFWPQWSRPQVIGGLVKWDALGSDPVERVALNISNGTVSTRVIESDFKMRELPAGQRDQSSRTVPGLEAASALVTELHSRVPHFQLIGWDLGIDKHAEPWIFEWNADHPALFAVQTGSGPVFAEGKILK